MLHPVFIFKQVYLYVKPLKKNTLYEYWLIPGDVKTHRIISLDTF